MDLNNGIANSEIVSNTIPETTSSPSVFCDETVDLFTMSEIQFPTKCNAVPMRHAPDVKDLMKQQQDIFEGVRAITDLIHGNITKVFSNHLLELIDSVDQAATAWGNVFDNSPDDMDVPYNREVLERNSRNITALNNNVRALQGGIITWLRPQISRLEHARTGLVARQKHINTLRKLIAAEKLLKERAPTGTTAHTEVQTEPSTPPAPAPQQTVPQISQETQATILDKVNLLEKVTALAKTNNGQLTNIRLPPNTLPPSIPALQKPTAPKVYSRPKSSSSNNKDN